MTDFGYARAATGDPIDGQLDVLRAHGVPDGLTYVDVTADARTEWDALLDVLVPGDEVVVSRPQILAGPEHAVVVAAAQIHECGAHLTPARAGIPERILLAGGASHWCARQSGRL
jgi:hypothetical protein